MTSEIRDETALIRHAKSPFFLAELEEMIALANCRLAWWFVDIGCGNGALVEAASKHGARGIGLDISRQGLRTATGRVHTGSFLQARAQDLPLRSGSVDVIFAQHVIEHLPDYRAALLEWFRILKHSGRLVVLTPNARYPNPAIYEDPEHVLIFESTTLQREISDSGLRVMRTETIFPHVSGHTVFGLRWRRVLGLIPPWRSSGRSLVCLAEKP